jgi:hypothetical protein
VTFTPADREFLAAAFFETVTLTGRRIYVLAVTVHATRLVRMLGATTHPTTLEGLITHDS